MGREEEEEEKEVEAEENGGCEAAVKRGRVRESRAKPASWPGGCRQRVQGMGGRKRAKRTRQETASGGVELGPGEGAGAAGRGIGEKTGHV